MNEGNHEEFPNVPHRQIVEHVYFAATKPVWSIISVLSGLLVAGFTYWLTTLAGSVTTLSDRRQTDVERMGRFDSKIESLGAGQTRIESAVQAVGEKLDRLIEHRAQ